MRKLILAIPLACFLCLYAAGQGVGQSGEPPEETAPLSLVFHHIGWNALRSVTYNYGLNFAGAGLGTWAFIASGLDWKWRNAAYENEGLSRGGTPGVYIGLIVPGLAPITAYLAGRAAKDERLQFTGLALTQSLILTLGVQSVLKMSTGRAPPGIATNFHYRKNPRTDDFSGEFNWFNMNCIDGWPSGHTANAFAAAAVVAELYHDNPAVKIGAYTYAVLMGLGMSVSVHWASEVFSGALIGYAVGKTVGKSYRRLLENNGENGGLTFYASHNTLGIILRL
ncbi:MAG: phosphatase PAP2 family protein [Treponema sp.]|jgi:membrane-associated phospholipid phosphatase|nr:phosphatase PAP2 family protein [Treponema sp.]